MSFAEQLKSSLDIVRVIGEELPLKRVGATARYVGRCPFHNEKTASFSVHRERQFFYCFGCHEKGDVITFVMKFHGVTFLEARDMLAARAGLAVPQRSERQEPEAELREVLHEMHNIAGQAFREGLFSNAAAEARAYVAKRGLRQSMVEEFGLGLADRSGSDMVKRLRKFKPEHVEASGLVLKRQDGTLFDRFRGRLMFPIHNEPGKLIAFGGRAMAEGDEPKYLNSPETHIYKKSAVLYNLHRARTAIRKADRVVLVEGYMDVIGVYSAGVQNVVASCGTALTLQQVKAIRRHSEHITINFDPDNAGMNATEKSMQILLDEDLRVRILELEGGLDPDEYVKEFGAAKYLERLERANGYFLWMADRVRRKHDMRTSEGRMEGFRALLPVILGVKDKIERASIANEVAEYLGIDRAIVLEEFRKDDRSRRGAQPAKPVEAAVPVREREILSCLLSGAGARKLLIPKLRSMELESLRTGGIIRVILDLHERQPEFEFADLEGRLDEDSRKVVTHLMFSADMDDVRAEDLAVCLGEQLGNNERQARASGLRARIKQAEREKNFEEAMRLMTELQGIEDAWKQGAGTN